MRAIVILILIIVAVALVRMLLGDVVKAVSKTMAAKPGPSPPPRDQRGSTAGRLVKDPETGSYIDERTALKAEVAGKTYFFESAASRDAFMRKKNS